MNEGPCGPGEVRGFFDALAATQYHHRLTIGEMNMDSPITHLFTVRDGKNSEFIDFLDTALVVERDGAATTAAARQRNSKASGCGLEALTGPVPAARETPSRCE